MKQIIILSATLLIFSVLYFLNNTKTDYLPKIDYILVEKSKRQMKVYSKDKLIKVYEISLGFNPIGPKEREGDGKTPEGIYYISEKNPKSRYHLSLRISYPTIKEKEIAKQKNLSPGADIMIHGIRGGLGWLGSMHLLKDWTLGCIAVTNEEIEEIYYAAPTGTKVEIKP